MRGFAWIAGGVLMLGCGQGSAARDRAADSTMAVVPTGGIDSSSPQSDSSVIPIAGGKLPTKSPAKSSTKAPAGPLTGYDSAFGPTFTVDSTGKVTPIVKKKP